MSELVVLVGLPASGKSTIAENYAKGGYSVFAYEKVRDELYGNFGVQGDDDSVFKVLQSRIRAALLDGKNVVYDAANINAKRRESFLSEVDRFDCHKHCVFMAVPYSVCVIRNQKRENRVPFQTMERMRKSFDIPYYFEGWDEITINRMRTSCDYEPFDYVESFVNVSMDNPRHSLTLGSHMKEAWRYAVNQEYNEYVQWAALLHDIGKPATKTFTKMNGRSDNVAHYYNHQNVGAYNALFMNYPKELTDEDILHIALLINYHMVPYTFGSGDIGREKMRNRLGDEIYNEMMQVHYCDINAR